VTNAVVAEDNPSQCDGTPGSNVSTDIFNRPQPKKHNMNEQVSDAGAASATISSVDADDHHSPGPQPSGQDGPEHSHSSRDLQDISGIHTERMGQQQQSIGDISTLLDTNQVGFNLNSYLPDRDGEVYIEDWRSTWLGINSCGQTTE
jgi:hypothetical protein